ncbi:MAG: Cobalt-containing nitrile hydratase subunit alpha [Candidatus Eremiobacteraeota bacterium]|nr:Cobalt-containing nitrile hydratase subunit alpha [Candidatus Eremiobacteraeota bacterium]
MSHVHDGAHESSHESSAGAANRVKTLVAALEAANVLTERELDETVESFLAHAQPANGARVVARAWVDDAFRERLLADGNAAVAELGIDLAHWAPVRLRVVANGPGRHNLIVCTLCSCYPLALLGPSPTWYKSDAYRSRAVRDPRGILAEFGTHVDAGVEITVWDSTAEVRYLVLPERPAGTESLSETELEALVTRNGLIGTALV